MDFIQYWHKWHPIGYWNAVSADQLGEQTAIKIGKGGLKGMTLAAELVSVFQRVRMFFNLRIYQILIMGI